VYFQAKSVCGRRGCKAYRQEIRLLHVLPSGFHRIRHYGLLANAGRREQLAQTRELLHVIPAAIEPPSSAATPVAFMLPTFVCPHCGAAMSISRSSLAANPCAPHRHRALRHENRHRLHQHYVRFAPATADSGRVCPTRPEPDFSASASSPNPASDHRHPASA
jgi:hypothetical protein